MTDLSATLSSILVQTHSKPILNHTLDLTANLDAFLGEAYQIVTANTPPESYAH